MPRPSLTRAWDALWCEGAYLGLHRLGAQAPQTDAQKAWVAAAEALGTGYSIAQVEAITELVRCTAAATKERWTEKENI